jgi:urea transport system ATP-binding protein
MLKVDNLNQYYGGSHILRGLSFDVPVGKVTTLLGRNGVGKTTLLKTLMGLVPAASGSIAFDGQDITRAPSYKRVTAGIGFVPQGREIFPRLTVEENLLMGLATRPRGSEIPLRIFDMFPVLKQMMTRRGGDLSGGQQQQLAIGRALAFGPKLLILDEPTEGIQPNIVHEIGDIIRRLMTDLNLTVILVEQKLPFARRVADRFIILDRGRLMASGPMPDLSEDLVKQYLTV